MAAGDAPSAAPNQAAGDDTVVAAQTAPANHANQAALHVNGADRMVPAQGPAQGAAQGAAANLGGGALDVNGGGRGGPPLQRPQGRAAPRQINQGARVAAPPVHVNQGDVVAGAPAVAPPLPNYGDWDVEAALMGPAFRKSEAGEFFFFF